MCFINYPIVNIFVMIVTYERDVLVVYCLDYKSIFIFTIIISFIYCTSGQNKRKPEEYCAMYTYHLGNRINFIKLLLSRPGFQCVGILFIKSGIGKKAADDKEMLIYSICLLVGVIRLVRNLRKSALISQTELEGKHLGENGGEGPKKIK